jgi:large subunit ribosomal protein L3
VKTEAKDGYNSIQVGYGNVSSKSLTQPIYKIKYSTIKIFKEFRIINQDELSWILKVDSLSAGQLVNICGKSIGKGFQDSESNFTRGPMTSWFKKIIDYLVQSVWEQVPVVFCPKKWRVN